MQYRKFTFKGKAENLSILSVFLFEDEFEGIEEAGQQMHAYIKLDAKNDLLSPEVKEFLHLNHIEFQSEIVNDANWNAIWESSFEPILVENKCVVRADHHSKVKNVDFDIIINPQMTFGTGHHPTTYLMIKKMLEINITNKSVFDFGTGTGVLAILAELMGAKQIFCNDIDENCKSNTLENFTKNNTKKAVFKLGDIDLIKNQKFDLILANVTRNTILERWQKLQNALNPNGKLIISGFQTNDKSFFDKASEQSNLKIVDTEMFNNWLVIVLNN